jgi:hypothetical protein
MMAPSNVLPSSWSMSSPLEVTGDDIARLDDSSLRELIGLLCEAEFRKARRSAAGVTWGGDQNAPDGGFDVVVETDDPYAFHGFLKGTKSAFQVKKSKMPPAEISKEMRPAGSLRAGIRELIHRSGSYVIVSAGDSTSASSLQARRDAMRDAVRGEPEHEQLLLDFLDRGKVATWVREHPSYILWVRDRVGRHIQGWQSYANWSNAPGGLEEEYLLDNEVRLYDDTRRPGPNEGLSIETALREVRSNLSSPGASLRLAGLSGVGKTRFAMALFDARIGDNALDPTLAFYTDVSHAPDPEPQRFAQGLVADGTRAVLIVDNCPPDLHRRLTSVCAAPESAVSLMTIEYDVREDLPPETSVFRLEPAGEGLITRLLEKRFQHLSQNDAQRIAHLSEGNARLAIALAGTAQRNETISGFRDDDLFKRLFVQRREPNELLLSSAEACSLVYSFDGEDTASEDGELRFLASLIGRTAEDLYRNVAELRTRDLVQKRGVWRAVLPHALANRLAGRALQRIPRNRIITAFLQSRSKRLIKSFTRRLSFLHDSEEALAIAEGWLEEGGWLGDVSNLSDFGIEVLQNIAPLSPERALLAVERAARADQEGGFATRQNPHRDSFVRLLRSLAYDAVLFRRCTRLICQFALNEEPDERHSSSRDVLASLFQLYLSGTHASPEDRVALIEELVATESERHQALALTALNSALEAWHFSSHYDFSFGARPRDFGYHARVQADVVHWYRTFIGCCVGLATSDQPIAEKAQAVLATSFRGLWVAAGMLDELEDAAVRLQGVCSWTQGWTAVRETLNFDRERLGPDSLSRLKGLEDFLQPRTLIDRARTYAFAHPASSLSWLEEEDSQEGSRRARMEDIVLHIASDVARDEAALAILLPEVVSTNGQFLGTFGKGLAEGCDDKSALWHRLRRAFEQVSDPAKRNPSALIGFLAASKPSDPAFCEATLDQLKCDPLLGAVFPWFQVAAGIDRRGLARLEEAAKAGGPVPVEQFRCLALGRQHEAIGDDELAELLERIASRKDGISVAVDILAMRFYPLAEKSGAAQSISLIECGRRLLTTYDYSPDKHDAIRSQYDLSRIARVSLVGPEGEDVARHVCEQILSEADRAALHEGYPDLLKTIVRLQPNAFLNVFVGGDPDSVARVGRRWWRLDDFDRDRNPLSDVSDESIISWCGKDRNVRYPRIALAVPTFVRNAETKGLEFSPLMLRLIEQAPDVAALLESMSGMLIPMSWSGSRADLLERRAVALQQLFEHARAEVSSWARHKHAELREAMRRERQFEESWRREQDESFE